MEQDERVPFIDEHEEEQRMRALNLMAEQRKIGEVLRPLPYAWVHRPRWYEQGALGAYFGRIWRRSTSSVGELLSTMR